jgi:hypothetical protein
VGRSRCGTLRKPVRVQSPKRNGIWTRSSPTPEPKHGEQPRILSRSSSSSNGSESPPLDSPDDDMSSVRVAIVGAGIAGLTAALRLAERNYDAMIYERRSHIGGQLGAHTHSAEDFGKTPYIGGRAHRPDTYHEHCYHVFLNWYHNFWQLTADIGVPRERHFEPRTSVRYLRRGEYPWTSAIMNPASTACRATHRHFARSISWSPRFTPRGGCCR